MDKSHAFERFTQALEYLESRRIIISQVELAEKLGITESALSSARRNKDRRFTKPLLKRFAMLFADYINEDWLLNGEGEMAKPEKDLLPHYPAKVSAGFLGGDAMSVSENEVEYREKMPGFKAYDFTIDVEGDSMVPIFYDGDIVACRKLTSIKELKSGKYYVIDTSDGAYIKRYVSSTKSSTLFASENNDFPTLRIRNEDIFGIAEVVGSLQKDPVQARKYYEQQLVEYAKKVLAQRLESPEVPVEDLIKQILKSK